MGGRNGPGLSKFLEALGSPGAAATSPHPSLCDPAVSSRLESNAPLLLSEDICDGV